MKKIFFYFVLFFGLVSCSVKTFQASNFDQKTVNHKTIAILPPIIFYTTPKIGKLTVYETKEQQIMEESKSFQEHLYHRLLRQSNKSKKAISISFQDIVKTNQLLNKAGIKQDKIESMSAEDLSKLLGVDAVVISTIEKALLIDGKQIEILGLGKQVLDVFTNTTRTPTVTNAVKLGDLKLTSSLKNAQDGQVLWKAWDDFEITIDHLPNEILTSYGNSCAKSFPYRN